MKVLSAYLKSISYAVIATEEPPGFVGETKLILYAWYVYATVGATI